MKISTQYESSGAEAPDVLPEEIPAPLFGEGGFLATDRLIPSEQAARWLVRQHGQRLVARGALLLICGRWHVMPRAFRRAVVELGHDAAQARVAA